MKSRLALILLVLLLAAPAFAQPKVPESIMFAGEAYRFDRPDLYERMDRELIAFTYAHTNSVLMLKRANRMFSQVVPILRKNGVPEDLKYLMAIECNLDPKSVSVAGARGPWQFMKASAREYGLEVNDEVDERFHIRKATEAACKYLKAAYAKYGDWLTVAASYNAGQGGISQRISVQKQKKAQDLQLPDETSRYIFRLLTAKYFFEHPEEFGFHVEPQECYPYIQPKETVSVSGPILDLADFAKDHGTTYFLLKEANLWLRADKLTNKSGKTYKIAIP
jgi:soluble lytic murein transglycosylase-like protein